MASVLTPLTGEIFAKKGKRTLIFRKILDLNPSFASPRTVRRGRKEGRTSVLAKAAVGFRSCSLLISTHCVMVGIAMRLNHSLVQYLQPSK